MLLLQFWVTIAQDRIDRSYAYVQDKLVVLQPAGEIINDLPVMMLLSDTTQLYKSVIDIVHNSFMKDAMEYYFLAATYLKNQNVLPAIEPAYLALSKNDGGFAKIGFHLKQGGELIEKANSPYIDLVEGRIISNPNRLMSVTQLYPHEMGHLLYGMLKSYKGKHNSRSVDMHYFSIRTDYSTAFNEGFAEHIENVSRIFEKNETIKNGIFKDIEEAKIKSKNAIKGFEKDFIYPLRFGYYKMSMPVWYQKYENLKRYEHAINGTVKYLNSTLELSNIEDQLTIKNAGIRQNQDELRNYVQMISTEGVISAFFTRLTQSDLADHYLKTSFYKPFLADTIAHLNSPEEIFTSVQNQFLKYFVVFHKHMSDTNSSNSEFINFIEGYILAFPSEEKAVKRIFKEVTNLEYTNKLPPDLWLLVKDHAHRLLVIDPYGGLTLPIYTFDLNASEIEDLLTIKGITREEAIKIIEYRKANGFFTSLNQIKGVEGISEASINQILNCKFDQEYVKDLVMPELSFKSLIITPLKQLIFRTLAYFVLILGIIFLFFFRREKPSFSSLFGILLKYLFQWILFVLAGLTFAVTTDQTWQFLILLVVFCALINVFIYRKSKKKRRRSIFVTALMGLFVLFSIV